MRAWALGTNLALVGISAHAPAMNLNVFREYDIRGVADRDFSDRFVRDLGRALGTFHSRRGKKKLAIGRDCRVSSDRLHEAMVSGLLSTGAKLVDVGVVPTPMLYFAVHSQDLDGGVEITGSHNPPEDNGFKMMKGKGSLFGDDIHELLDLMQTQNFVERPGGSIDELDLADTYVGFMKGNIKLGSHKPRVAIDAGNGAAGPIAVKVFEALGIDTKALLCEMDGTFPVHHPDPTEPESLELLRETVLREGLDAGIAFDGDGDRIGVIDKRGEILWGDRLLTLFSRALLKDHPGAAVIGEVKCSQVLYDDIAKNGGRPILWKTGHSLIKTKMKEEKAMLAGEMSGHLFFADRFYGFDDAVYAAARLVELLSLDSAPLHERLSDLPVTSVTPEIRVPCADELKFDLVARVRAHFQATHDVITVDGARIQFGDGAWGLVRASNTQPVLVLRFEAQDRATLDSIRAEVEGVVEDAKNA